MTEFAALGDFESIRHIDDHWYYSLIRDYTSNDIVQTIIDDFGTINAAAINESKDWFLLGDITGRYFIVRLITDNSADMRFRNLEYNVDLDRR